MTKARRSQLPRGTFVLGMGAAQAGAAWLGEYFARHKSFATGFRREFHVLDCQHIEALQFRRKAMMARLGDLDPMGDPTARKHLHAALLVADPDQYYNYFHGMLMRSGRGFASDLTPTHALLPKSALREVVRAFGRRNIGVKPVFLMRDPVDRAWSELRSARRDRRLPMRELAALGIDDPYGHSDDALLRLLTQTDGLRPQDSYSKIIGRIEDVFAPQDIWLGFTEELGQEDSLRSMAETLGMPYAPAKKPLAAARANVLEPQTLHDLTQHHRKTYRYCAERWGAHEMAEIWPNTRRIWREVAPTLVPVPSWGHQVATRKRARYDKITRIVLHIGTHKTGTTAIQQTLHQNATTLLSHGIYYPPLGRLDRHSILSIPFLTHVPREFAHRFGKDKKLARTEARGLWSKLAETVAARDDVHTLVLSSEHFARAKSPAKLLEQVQTLAPEARIDTVCYLRRPDDRYLSGLQQRIKASHRLRWPGQADLLPDLAPWADHSSVVLREYNRERLVGGDVVRDMLQVLGFAGDVDTLRIPERANASMSAEAMAAMLMYRQSVHADHNNRFTRDSKTLMALLDTAATDLPEELQPTRAELHDQVRMAAVASARSGLEALDTQYGFRFSDPALYDTEAIDAALAEAPLDTTVPPRLSQIIPLDDDRVRALYSAVLARLLRPHG